MNAYTAAVIITVFLICAGGYLLVNDHEIVGLILIFSGLTASVESKDE